MATIRMITDRIFTEPTQRRGSVKYLAGRTYRNVKKDWAEEMINLGQANAVDAPPAPARSPRRRAKRPAAV